MYFQKTLKFVCNVNQQSKTLGMLLKMHTLNNRINKNTMLEKNSVGHLNKHLAGIPEYQQ